MSITPNAALVGALLLASVGGLLILAAELMMRRPGAEYRPQPILGLWRFGYAMLAFGAASFTLWLWLSRAFEPPTSKGDRPLGALAMLVMGALLAALPGRVKRHLEDFRDRAKAPVRWYASPLSTIRLESMGWLFMLVGLVYLGIWLSKNL